VTSIPASFSRRTEVIGIEQTMSGTYWEQFRGRTMPVIDVASSAAKKFVEAPLVSEAIMRKLTSRSEPLTGDQIYGVAGLGNVGMAVARALRAYGHSIYAFDPRPQEMGARPQGVNVCSTLRELFERSNYIFGCTGRDILASEPWWTTLEGRKVLVSCSSNDTEFSTVLATLNESPNDSGALSDLTVKLTKGELVLLRAGYPYNFDGTSESVPLQNIQMTRGLLLGGVLQAVSYEFKNADKSRSKMLSPELQKFVVDSWLRLQPECGSFYSEDVRDIFQDVSSIAANSGRLPDVK
jgi:hypothetical protein